MTAQIDIANRALQRCGHTKHSSTTLAAAGINRAGRLILDAYGPVRDEVVRSMDWNCLKKRVVLTGATITDITNANPAVFTTSGAHGFAVGELVRPTAVVGMEAVNTVLYRIITSGATTFEVEDAETGVTLDTSDTAVYVPYVSDGLATLKPEFGYDQMYPLPDDFVRALELDEYRYSWVIEGDRLMSTTNTVELRYIGHPDALTETDPDDLGYDAMLISVMAQRLAVEICEPLTQSNTKLEAQAALLGDLMGQASAVNVQEQSPQELLADSWLLARQ